MKRISLDQAAYAILKLPELLDYDEPIGQLTPTALQKISSCIETPFARYGRQYSYWFLYQRAAAMFYFLIKNHPLENGNKRTAVVVTMSFLVMNGKWMSVTPDALYRIAIHVAESPANESDAVIAVLAQNFKKHLKDF